MLVAALGSKMETEDRKIIDYFVFRQLSPCLFGKNWATTGPNISAVQITKRMKHRLMALGSHSGVLHNPLNIKNNSFVVNNEYQFLV